MIGTRRRDLDASAGARSPPTTGRCTTAGNIVVSAAGNLEHDRLLALLERVERRARRPRDGRPARAPAARASRRRPASASSARTPSSTTSASARPASRAPTGGASPPRCSTRSSAAPRRRGSSRRSARSAGWRTAVYSFASQYTRHGPDRRLRRHARGEPRCVPRDLRRADRRRSPPATSARGELERAKENLKGRIMLSMESTSNRMSRLGKSLITDTELLTFERIIAEIDAVDAGRGRRARERAAPAGAAVGVGRRARTRSASVARSSGPTRRSSRAPRHEGRASSAREGKVGRALVPALERGRPRGARDRARRRARRRRARRGGRLHDAGRGSSERAAPRSSRACRASSARPAGTAKPLDELARERGAAPLRRAELLDRRRADDALRRSRRRSTCRARRSSSCTTRRRRTRRPARRGRRPS